jgi:hypothetical protein
MLDFCDRLAQNITTGQFKLNPVFKEDRRGPR